MKHGIMFVAAIILMSSGCATTEGSSNLAHSATKVDMQDLKDRELERLEMQRQDEKIRNVETSLEPQPGLQGSSGSGTPK